MTRLIDADELKADIHRQILILDCMGMVEIARKIEKSLELEIDKIPTAEALSVSAVRSFIKEFGGEASCLSGTFRPNDVVSWLQSEFEDWVKRIGQK